MKKIPFGFRIYVVGLLAFGLAYLTFYMTMPIELSQADHTLREVFYRTVGLAYLFALGQILKARVRKVFYGAYLLGLGYFVFQLVRIAVSDQELMVHAQSLIGGESLSFFGWRLALPLSIALLPPFLMYWWAWFKEHEFYRMYLEGLGGAAKFGSIKSFHKHPGKLHQPLITINDEGVTSPNIFIGRTLFRHDPMPRLIGIDDETHLCTIAPSRTGKSVSTINNVAGTYLGDMIFIDPKGEHTENLFHRRCSSAFLKEKNIPVPKGVTKHLPNGEGIVLDPCNITNVKSGYYNPLSEIDITADNCRELISAIADGCILAEKQKHFEEIPKKILKGLIAYVLGRFPNDPEKHNLPYILDLLIGINEDGFADSSRFDELLLDMLVCNAAGGLAQEASTLLSKMGDKEKGGHLGVLARGLEWCGDPAMRKHLVKSDFSFSNIGTKVNSKGKRVKQSIFIVLPDTRMNDLKRWMRVILAVSTVAMRRRKHHPDHRTLFILDEFPLLGHIQTIEDGFGLFAGYHQKLWIFAQGLGQLKAHYSTYWNSMIAQSTVQFFGQPATDLETLEFISKALGNHNITNADIKGFGASSSRGTRNLLTPSEIAALIGKGKNKQIVFPSGGFPLLLERLTFKPMSIGGKRFSGLPLDGLRGHFPNRKKS